MTLLEEFKKLYKPPFRFHLGYIWDANNNMVADEVMESAHEIKSPTEVIRVRGWGRISSNIEDQKHAEEVQDAFGNYLAELLTKNWENNL